MKGLLLGGIFALPLLLGLRMRGFLQDRARHLETLEQAAAALEPELRAGRLPPQEALHALETGASDPLLTGEEREAVSGAEPGTGPAGGSAKRNIVWGPGAGMRVRRRTAADLKNADRNAF